MRSRILQLTNSFLISKRFYSKQVRVRFAPSPTGYLHLGGLRTALYNYLFARANNGTFILRIEDTDQSRLVPGSMEKLQDDLFWAGIISDEDPIRGGPYGPYIQSKRIDIYKENVHTLLDNKTAYYCFCTEKRLELLRREALKCGYIPKYDNRCRHLSHDEVNVQLKKGRPYCIRFKLSSEVEAFDDLIYGRIIHDIAQNEGDPIIMKSDGYPTYHFANVVDDHYMNISHVLRGVEWQISTPKHIMLHKAFGWEPPIYGHLPLILNSDGSKLSKRQDDVRIEWYRKAGIFPLALLNFITYAGSGFVRKQDTQKIYTYEDLIKQFDVTRINTNSTRLLPEKLLEFNKLEIARLLSDDKNHKYLVNKVTKLVKEQFEHCNSNYNLQLDEYYVISTLKWIQNRISNLTDLVKPEFSFLWVVPASPPDLTQSECLDAIKYLNATLCETDSSKLTTDWLRTYLKEFAKTNGVSFPKLMKTLRSILSGLEQGPSVAEMIEILGKDKTLSRIQRCLP